MKRCRRIGVSRWIQFSLVEAPTHNVVASDGVCIPIRPIRLVCGFGPTAHTSEARMSTKRIRRMRFQGQIVIGNAVAGIAAPKRRFSHCQNPPFQLTGAHQCVWRTVKGCSVDSAYHVVRATIVSTGIQRQGTTSQAIKG